MASAQEIPIRPIAKMDVEIAIRNYWIVLMSKQAEMQQDCFTENAFIFASSSRRIEPGRLVQLRRQREYMTDSAKVNVNVGHIEVEILSQDSAVAAYTMQFDAQQKEIVAAGSSRTAEEHFPNARVTQVFVRHSDGNLRIAHEHISVPDEPRDSQGRG
jgi:ketosteroid isomerase-like protein